MSKLTPSYSQLSIGFDRMFQELDRLMQTSGSTVGGYPPFNVERLDENNHRITMAVAGFSESEIDITFHDNVLSVKGEKTDEDGANFLYRGIAKRNFRREFALADHVEVKTASLKDGMLIIDFEQTIPESAKPKRIPLIKE
jgi:molecular chaperone IbpA